MPLLDDMTHTSGDGGLHCNGCQPGRALQSDWGEHGFLATSAGAHRDFQLDVPRTRTIGSVGANLIYTARGSAVGAFLPNARLWDLVAGAAILSRAGGELRYLSGREIDYVQLLAGNLTPEPMIAGHPHVLGQLQQVIVAK
jgi:fructose-1,6-bisphosphatase/inositol monophosphatase family enzyme